MKRRLLGIGAAFTLLAGITGANVRSVHAQAPPYYILNASTFGTWSGAQCTNFHFCFSFHGTGFSDQFGPVTDNGTGQLPYFSNGVWGYVTMFKSTVFGTAPGGFGGRTRPYQTFYGRAGSYTINADGTLLTLTINTIEQDHVVINAFFSGPFGGVYIADYNGGCFGCGF